MEPAPSQRSAHSSYPFPVSLGLNEVIVSDLGSFKFPFSYQCLLKGGLNFEGGREESSFPSSWDVSVLAGFCKPGPGLVCLEQFLLAQPGHGGGKAVKSLDRVCAGICMSHAVAFGGG